MSPPRAAPRWANHFPFFRESFASLDADDSFGEDDSFDEDDSFAEAAGALLDSEDFDSEDFDSEGFDSEELSVLASDFDSDLSPPLVWPDLP